MVGFLDAATSAVRRSFCSATNRAGTWSELLLGSENPLGSAAQGLAEFGRAIACDLPPPSPASPPFTGGQCFGARYRINHTVVFERNGQADLTQPGFVDVPGPVGAPELFNTSTQAGLRFSGATSTTNPTRTLYTGVSSTVAGGFPKAKSYSIQSVQPIDGGANNCGNPAPVRPPYTPGSNSEPETITYTDVNNTTVNVPIVVAFGYAQVNINGQVTIPFTLNATLNAPINVSGELNLSTGDINFGGGNPGSSSGGCDKPPDSFKPDGNLPDPPSGIDTGDPPDPIDPAKPQLRKQIRGAIVTTTTVPPGITVIPQGSDPDVFAPDVGLISFLIEVGGQRAWTEDIRIKNQRQFVPLNWDGGAVDVKGTPRVGGAFTVSPVYVKVTDQQTYPE